MYTHTHTRTYTYTSDVCIMAFYTAVFTNLLLFLVVLADFSHFLFIQKCFNLTLILFFKITSLNMEFIIENLIFVSTLLLYHCNIFWPPQFLRGGCKLYFILQSPIYCWAYLVNFLNLSNFLIVRFLFFCGSFSFETFMFFIHWYYTLFNSLNIFYKSLL